jgi:hypothetical protein
MMVGMASAGALMACIVASSVALQRSFYWSTDYATESVAQLRVMDFVTRDIRGAKSVSLLSGRHILALEIPDAYSGYDAQGNPTSAPVDPAVLHGAPEYGDKTLPLIVTYYMVGSSLCRQQIIQATGQVNELVIATGLSNFEAEFVGGGNLVRATVTFQPRFRSDAQSEARTAVSATVAARPARTKYEETAIL